MGGCCPLDSSTIHGDRQVKVFALAKEKERFKSAESWKGDTASGNTSTHMLNILRGFNYLRTKSQFWLWNTSIQMMPTKGLVC